MITFATETGLESIRTRIFYFNMDSTLCRCHLTLLAKSISVESSSINLDVHYSFMDRVLLQDSYCFINETFNNRIKSITCLLHLKGLAVFCILPLLCASFSSRSHTC